MTPVLYGEFLLSSRCPRALHRCSIAKDTKIGRGSSCPDRPRSMRSFFRAPEYVTWVVLLQQARAVRPVHLRRSSVRKNDMPIRGTLANHVSYLSESPLVPSATARRSQTPRASPYIARTHRHKMVLSLLESFFAFTAPLLYTCREYSKRKELITLQVAGAVVEIIKPMLSKT